MKDFILVVVAIIVFIVILFILAEIVPPLKNFCLFYVSCK